MNGEHTHWLITAVMAGVTTGLTIANYVILLEILHHVAHLPVTP